jgi:nitrate reductase NapE component
LKKSKEQRAKNKEQRAKNKEQRVKSKEQRAKVLLCRLFLSFVLFAVIRVIRGQILLQAQAEPRRGENSPLLRVYHKTAGF